MFWFSQVNKRKKKKTYRSLTLIIKTKLKIIAGSLATLKGNRVLDNDL